jgi:hypothetical protein
MSECSSDLCWGKALRRWAIGPALVRDTLYVDRSRMARSALSAPRRIGVSLEAFPGSHPSVVAENLIFLQLDQSPIHGYDRFRHYQYSGLSHDTAIRARMRSDFAAGV